MRSIVARNNSNRTAHRDYVLENDEKIYLTCNNFNAYSILQVAEILCHKAIQAQGLIMLYISQHR